MFKNILLTIGTGLVLWLAMIGVSQQFISPHIEYRPNNEFSRLGFWTGTNCSNTSCNFPGLMAFPGLHTIYNFDGVHYYTIATQGYDDQGRFFPFVPLVLSFFHQLGFGLWSGWIVVILGLVCMTWSLWKLLSLDFKQNQKLWILVALLTSPAAFFLGMTYTESWFIGLVALSLWSARTKRWWLSGLFASLVMTTRLTGIIMLPVLAVEWLSHKSTKHSYIEYLKENWQQLIPLALSPILLGLYSFYNYVQWQDWLYFLHAHSDLGNSRSSTSLVFPLKTVWRYGKILWSLSPNLYEWWVSLLELVSFGSVTLMLSWATWQRRQRISYLVYGWLAFLLPVLSGTFSGLPRYSLVILPIWITLGIIPHSWPKYLYFILQFGLMIVLAILVSRGYFVA